MESRGAPDWYSLEGVTYGLVNKAINVGTVSANSDETLLELTGRGIVYGGHVHVGASGSLYRGVVEYHIDGVNISINTLSQLSLFGLDRPESHSVYLLKYDDIWYRYAMALSPRITFGKSVKVRFDNNDPYVATFFARLYYALMV